MLFARESPRPGEHRRQAHAEIGREIASDDGWWEVVDIGPLHGPFYGN
jgi:hypothetical protein